jgi:hypothetical protein
MWRLPRTELLLTPSAMDPMRLANTDAAQYGCRLMTLFTVAMGTGMLPKGPFALCPTRVEADKAIVTTIPSAGRIFTSLHIELPLLSFKCSL